jgi:hypothetical protein
MKRIWEKAAEIGDERETRQRTEMGDEAYDAMIADEPSALAFTQMEEKIDDDEEDDSASDDEAKRINDNAEAALKKAAEEDGKLNMTRPSDLLVKDTNIQVKDARSDTPISLNKEIDPRTGKYKIM